MAEKKVKACERCGQDSHWSTLCSTCQKQAADSWPSFDAGYRAGQEDERKACGERVIDHCLRGKDHTAAGYYTAVTGIQVQGVVLDDGRPVVLLGHEVSDG